MTTVPDSAAWSKHSSKYDGHKGEAFSVPLVRAACQSQWFSKLDESIAAKRASTVDGKEGGSPIKVLILASGTGAELSVLCERYTERDMSILATDFAEGMIQATQATIEKLGKQSMASTKIINAMDITEADASFDVVFLVLGPMLMPDPFQVFREIQRVLVPGGWSAYLTPGHMEVHDIMTAARREVLAASGRVSEYKSFYEAPMIGEWGAPELLAAKLEKAGFKHIHSELVFSLSSVERGKGIDDMLRGIYDNPGMNMFYLSNLSEAEAELLKETIRRTYHERWPESQPPALARPYCTAVAACAHRD